MEEDIRASAAAGFVDHLVKPITFQRLAAAIEKFFEKNPVQRDGTK
jgi:response regulator of citrate/malate metabolism